MKRSVVVVEPIVEHNAGMSRIRFREWTLEYFETGTMFDAKQDYELNSGSGVTTQTVRSNRQDRIVSKNPS